MKVAFLNRGRETHPGGDLIALDATMAALRKIGVECEETGWDAERIKDFDLAQMFHCNFDWSWGNYQAIRKAGKPYVLTPIYYPGLLSGIEDWQALEMLRNARFVFPFSHDELADIQKQFQLSWTPLWPIPNGTDPEFHAPNTVFFAEVGIGTREGVLCVSARGASDKRCEDIWKMCVEAQIPFSCASGICHTKMPQYYREARVFINASDSERMSLTIGEALCAGCRALATSGNRGNEWYGGGLYTFDPKDLSADMIECAYNAKEWDYSPNAAARKLTWDYVARQLKGFYEQVIS